MPNPYIQYLLGLFIILIYNILNSSSTPTKTFKSSSIGKSAGYPVSRKDHSSEIYTQDRQMICLMIPNMFFRILRQCRKIK